MEWTYEDQGGFLYLADGRVIIRKPNQSDEDAIKEGEEWPRLDTENTHANPIR